MGVPPEQHWGVRHACICKDRGAPPASQPLPDHVRVRAVTVPLRAPLVLDHKRDLQNCSGL